MTSFAASFEQGRCVFDEDILQNSEAAVETLVRVGMSIGRAVLPSP
jgi:phosphatidylserine decarboxylase